MLAEGNKHGFISVKKNKIVTMLQQAKLPHYQLSLKAHLRYLARQLHLMVHHILLLLR